MSVKIDKLLVYGTLKRGGYNHDYFLKKAKYISDLVTLPKYTMYKLGTYPGVVMGGDSKIQGEVFEVNSHELAKLDRFEGHPSLFKRTLIKLDSTERVWMYLYQQETDMYEVIPNGCYIV